jgi:hypothetical protein
MPKERRPARKPAQRRQTRQRRRDPVAPMDLAARRQAVRAAKQQFDAAHAEGMRALRSGQTYALGKAIQDERDAVKKLAALPLYKPPRKPVK